MNGATSLRAQVIESISTAILLLYRKLDKRFRKYGLLHCWLGSCKLKLLDLSLRRLLRHLHLCLRSTHNEWYRFRVVGLDLPLSHFLYNNQLSVLLSKGSRRDESSVAPLRLLRWGLTTKNRAVNTTTSRRKAQGPRYSMSFCIWGSKRRGCSMPTLM